MAKAKQVAEIPYAERAIRAGEPFALSFRPRDPAGFPAEMRGLRGRAAVWRCCGDGRETNDDGERLWTADDPAFRGMKIPEGDLRHPN